MERPKRDDFVKIEGKKYFFQKAKIRETEYYESSVLILFWVKDKIEELAKEGKGIVIVRFSEKPRRSKRAYASFKKNLGAQNIKIIFLKLKSRSIQFGEIPTEELSN